MQEYCCCYALLCEITSLCNNDAIPRKDYSLQYQYKITLMAATRTTVAVAAQERKNGHVKAETAARMLAYLVCQVICNLRCKSRHILPLLRDGPRVALTSPAELLLYTLPAAFALLDGM